MGYKQTKDFVPSKGGTQKGMCLKNVRLGYGIGPKYDDATQAWNNTQQHTTRSIPSGVEVPLFYSYTTTIGGVRRNYGHINVQLADGRVWSDGEYFNSLSHYEAVKAPVYIGWGESINGVRVLEHVPEPSLPAPSGGAFRVNPGFKFRVYEPGTVNVKGVIDYTWGWYLKRGTDPKYPNRWLFNSAQLGVCAFPYANVNMKPYTGEYSQK